MIWNEKNTFDYKIKDMVLSQEHIIENEYTTLDYKNGNTLKICPPTKQRSISIYKAWLGLINLFWRAVRPDVLLLLLLQLKSFFPGSDFPC